MNKQKIIAFDLDDVLCERESGRHLVQTSTTTVFQFKNIDVVNSLYDDGHKIIIYTARGMTVFWECL